MFVFELSMLLKVSLVANDSLFNIYCFCKSVRRCAFDVMRDIFGRSFDG